MMMVLSVRIHCLWENKNNLKFDNLFPDGYTTDFADLFVIGLISLFSVLANSPAHLIYIKKQPYYIYIYIYIGYLIYLLYIENISLKKKTTEEEYLHVWSYCKFLAVLKFKI